jgi:hypothetical protein
MRQRGHVLLLMMVVLAGIGVASVGFANRANTRIEGREISDVRIQALLLARSAVVARVSGVHRVETDVGTAIVRVVTVGAEVEVKLAGARAVVRAESPRSRFTAAE